MPDNSCRHKLVNGQWMQVNVCNENRGCPPVPMATLNAILSEIQVSHPTLVFANDDELQFDCFDDGAFSSNHYETKVWFRRGGSNPLLLVYTINKPENQPPTLAPSSGDPKPLLD